MAERELSILVKAKGAIDAARDIGKVDTAVGKLGRTAATGVKTASQNIARGGVVIGAGIALGVKNGLESLATLEDATTSVEGAIAQAGLTGQITSAQIATWANEIETNVQAAFDDKAITQAAAALIRFGKVTPENLEQSLVVMTDLAAKTGDVDSASELLAKALADPAKAAGKLARVGVVLTKSQQDQIKAMVKAGDTAAAQALLLDALAETTSGAAAASAGEYRDALNLLSDASEDAQRALAIGFIPVISKVADLLSTELAKPSTIKALQEFGTGLASGLDQLIDIARGLPWGSIGDAFALVGQGSKAALDFFTGLPPWVQTAVLTGWGLNKLTGGALGSIVGTLGSGLIKGVLGMNAGVVNIKAGAVTGVGGGVPAAGGGGGGVLAKAGAFLGFVGIASIAVGVGQAIADAIGATPDNPASGASRAYYRQETGASGKIVGTLSTVRDSLDLTRDSVNRASTQERAKIDATNAKLEANRLAVAAAATATAAASRAAGIQAAAAIRDKDLSVTLNNRVTVPVTIRGITKTQTISTRIGMVAS